MKKAIVAATLSLMAMSASARELTLVGGFDYSEAESTIVGVGLSETYGMWTVAVGAERNVRDERDGDRVAVVVSHDLGLNVKGFPIVPKFGAAYVNPDGIRSGYAWLVGVGTRYPVTETLSVGLDYRYQVGENDVRAWDGNQVLVSLNHKF